MGLVTRFFDLNGNGTADGTSYDNRAPLLVGGNWSSIITGFNFGSSDVLFCRVEPGEYIQAQALANGLFSSNPTRERPLFFSASNGGVPWQPPSGWRSCELPWDYGVDLPHLRDNASTTRYNLVQNGHFNFLGFRFTKNNQADAVIEGTTQVVTRWCVFRNLATLGPSPIGGIAQVASAEACVWRTSGIHPTLSRPTGCLYENCRFLALSPMAGVSIIVGASPTNHLIRCTFENCTDGYRYSNVNRGNADVIDGCTFAGCDRAISWSNDRRYDVQNCFVGGGNVGIESGADGRTDSLILNTRIRATTPILRTAENYPTDFVFTEPGSDAAEFVDAANGDLRIKRTSIYWGRGIGAGDESGVGGIPIGRIISGGV